MNDIRIRQANVEDIPALSELFDAYRRFYEQPADLPLATRFIRERMDNRDSEILVADDGGRQLVGFSQLYPTFCSVLAAPIFVLYDLFVAPQARKTGVGRMLLLAAHDLAIKHGKARMDLTTAKTNLGAQALYESLGWERDEIFYTYNKTTPR